MVSTRRKRSRQIVTSIERSDGCGPLAQSNEAREAQATSEAQSILSPPLHAVEHDKGDGVPIAHTNNASDDAADEHSLTHAQLEGAAASTEHDSVPIAQTDGGDAAQTDGGDAAEEHALTRAQAEGAEASPDCDRAVVSRRLSAIEGRLNELATNRSRAEATVIANQRTMARQMEQFQTNLAASLRRMHAAVLERPLGVAPATPSASVPLPPPPTPHTNVSTLTAEQQARAEASKAAAQSRLLSRQPMISPHVEGSAEVAKHSPLSSAHPTALATSMVLSSSCCETVTDGSVAPNAPEAITGSATTNPSAHSATSVEQQARSRSNHETAKRRLEERRAYMAAIPPATMDALRARQAERTHMTAPSTVAIPAPSAPTFHMCLE